MSPLNTVALHIVHVRSENRPDLPIRRSLGEADVVSLPLARYPLFKEGGEGTLYVIDVDLRDPVSVRLVRAGAEIGHAGKSIFVVDPGNRAQEIQAQALGADTLVTRPIDDGALEQSIRQLYPSIHALERRVARERNFGVEPAEIAAGSVAVAALFDGFKVNVPPTSASLQAWSEDVDAEIDAVGLDRWVSSVRNHHRGTYQHCMLVSGIASRFGAALGLPAAERQVLTAAALVHDLGKVRISPELLDKIGRLTAAEFAIIKKHPVIGAEFLADADLDPRIVSAVRHHHEHLDGSGYPDGLSGAEIPSIVRLVTISDIFGALVEQRSYKLPTPSHEAYRYLVHQADAGKLDKALVRAFQSTALELTTTRVTVAMDAPTWAGHRNAGTH